MRHHFFTASTLFAALQLACGSSDGPDTAPPAMAPDAVMLASDGSAVTLSAASGASELLLVRVVTSWCGTCRWSAAHTGELVPAELAPRVQVLDALVRGADNAPVTGRDMAAWQARSDGVAEVLADPSHQLRDLFPARAALPLVAVIEPGTRRVFSALSNPAPEEVEGAVRAALAQLAGEALPAPREVERQDGRFTRDQWEMIAAMRLEGRPAPDSSNAVADDPRAAAFGRRLFASEALSPTGVSCQSCHWPGLSFQDGRETPSEGRARLDRNAPTTLLAGFADTQLWDGRADSQWMQALLPIESSVEFGSSRSFAVRAVREQYQAEYEAIFGPLPNMDDASLAAAAGPGDAAWEALPEAQRSAITRAFVNIGKSIAAFERSQSPTPNALDEYGSGRLDALSEEQKDGLAGFFAAGCAQCHYGPLFSDGAFHNLHFPSGRRDRMADRGRLDGLDQLLASEFNRFGPHSDAPDAFEAPAPFPQALGAFKTPSLRGVGYTLPYGHGGSYWGLTSVIEAHRTGGLDAGSPFTTGELEPFLPEFDAALTAPIMTFLLGLRIGIESGLKEAGQVGGDPAMSEVGHESP